MYLQSSFWPFFIPVGLIVSHLFFRLSYAKIVLNIIENFKEE